MVDFMRCVIYLFFYTRRNLLYVKVRYTILFSGLYDGFRTASLTILLNHFETRKRLCYVAFVQDISA